VVPLGVNVTASFDLKKPGVSLLALGTTLLFVCLFVGLVARCEVVADQSLLFFFKGWPVLI
jgi:hypothetical protein